MMGLNNLVALDDKGSDWFCVSVTVSTTDIGWAKPNKCFFFFFFQGADVGYLLKDPLFWKDKLHCGCGWVFIKVDIFNETTNIFKKQKTESELHPSVFLALMSCYLMRLWCHMFSLTAFDLRFLMITCDCDYSDATPPSLPG